MVFYAYYFVSLLYVPFVLFHIIYKGTSCKSEWAYPVCTYTIPYLKSSTVSSSARGFLT